MTPIRLAVAIALVPAVASADPGHWAQAGGHNHWIALGALGVAGLAAVVALLKERRKREREPVPADTEAEGAEAEA